ncbi:MULTISPECIES: hypothetical protein [unclassified Leptolyngbya]|jgi:hypothetical protein|uniref:hypothetical protein n=1 Tax=unclassified Leptolyngbya TaxID=2650499 RepID=UPI00168A0041|nr:MULTISPECIES: hypothetical protein [unclassified Leptolyngbya]MBD1912638.1 hypothetical protein [Leptolyngbya sp. FACHB-8]MBD2156808.1 hypothetical protein [Leptolyngbya sp. FACHB-16]
MKSTLLAILHENLPESLHYLLDGRRIERWGRSLTITANTAKLAKRTCRLARWVAPALEALCCDRLEITDGRSYSRDYSRRCCQRLQDDLLKREDERLRFNLVLSTLPEAIQESLAASRVLTVQGQIYIYVSNPDDFERATGIALWFSELGDYGFKALVISELGQRRTRLTAEVLQNSWDIERKTWSLKNPG